jgi:hypothetical protein
VTATPGENGLLLELPAPKKVGPVQRWFAKPNRFELEAVGMFVWSELDGNRTAQTIAQRLASKHHLSLREAEMALASFLTTLVARDLVQIVEPKGKKR